MLLEGMPASLSEIVGLMGGERGRHVERCAATNDLICGKIHATNTNVV
jgi:hypothetical protein